MLNYILFVVGIILFLTYTYLLLKDTCIFFEEKNFHKQKTKEFKSLKKDYFFILILRITGIGLGLLVCIKHILDIMTITHFKDNVECFILTSNILNSVISLFLVLFVILNIFRFYKRLVFE